MKKLSMIVAVLTIAVLLWTPALAAEKDPELTVKIESMVVKKDKNGATYVRFICPVHKISTNGTAYTDQLPFMAFGNLVPAARKYKEGQEMTVIAKSRYFNGRQSYTILKFVAAPKAAKK